MFVNPVSGTEDGEYIWKEDVHPLFKAASVKSHVIGKTVICIVCMQTIFWIHMHGHWYNDYRNKLYLYVYSYQKQGGIGGCSCNLQFG